MKYAFDLIKSDRKTISIQIRPDGKLVVRAPSSMPYGKIVEFVESKASWIDKTVNAHGLLCKNSKPFSDEELKKLSDKAEIIIPPKVKKYADLMDVTYNKITFRTQKTRWGSCSSKGNLNFNSLMVLMPDRVIDSIIVHELAHRKEMNHSPRFYDLILSLFPDYYECEKWLHENGTELMARLYRDK